MAKPVYYISPAPEACDLISDPRFGTKHDNISEKGEFVDGRLRVGPWANMCMTCHKTHGVGLGTGLGQRFTRQADGRWLKTGG